MLNIGPEEYDMNDLLWQRVEAALDARRDPLADPELVKDLSGDPEALEAVRRLMLRIDALPASIEPARRRSIRLGILAVAAGLIALVAASFLLLDQRDEDPATNGESLAAASTRPDVSLVIETTRIEPARGQRVVLQPQRVLTWNLEER